MLTEDEIREIIGEADGGTCDIGALREDIHLLLAERNELMAEITRLLVEIGQLKPAARGFVSGHAAIKWVQTMGETSRCDCDQCEAAREALADRDEIDDALDRASRPTDGPA